MPSPEPVHYLPIATTVLSAAFVAVLLRRAAGRRWPPHLMWWAVGIFFYGFGTAFESAITLLGNTPTLNRLWYWAGAILGGYPLATGSLYLLAPRRVAHALTAGSMVVVVFASAAVLLSPMDAALIEPHRPGGAALGWQWVRLVTPVINVYAVVFLVGGAIWSSVRFALRGDNPGRAVGTALIAAGAILPGVGGAMTKAGTVEALYVGELAGLVLIVAGYVVCVRSPAPVRPGGPEGGTAPTCPACAGSIRQVSATSRRDAGTQDLPVETRAG